MKKLRALVMTFLAISSIPIKDGKVAFDDDQEAKLKEQLEEADYNKIVDAFNKEVEQNATVKKFKEQITSILEEMPLTDDEKQQLARADLSDEDDTPDDIAQKAKSNPDLAASVELLKTKVKQQEQYIEALVNGDEADVPMYTIKGAKMKEAIKHSATHLFSSNKAYDAFDGRNWNKRAAGLVTTATDFSEGSTIDKLNGDLNLYYRENPDKLESLHRDNFGLPSNWSKRTKVDDKVADGSIATAELSQARKLPWLAKNKQLIKPEEGQVFPISIDIEFVGHLLSNIEASWLNMYNKEGSQAYKWTFVRFLVTELDKRARLEDRIATIKGVYVATPDGATTPGKFINRQNGLLYLLWKARDIDKKYRAFDIGTPTTANILDYVDNLIKALPIEVRNTPGLELQISPYWRKAYRKRFREVHGMEQDFKGEPDYPKDYPNVMFQELVDLEGSDIMVITYSDNVEILENIPAEKSLYKFETLLRIIYVFADYKMGIRFKHIGNKVKDGDPDEFKVQTVWSNAVPVFDTNFFVPVHDDATGEVSVNFKNLQVSDDWDTVITKFNDVTPGQIIKIQGNTKIANARTVADNANIELAGDAAFNLQSGGTLTLYVVSESVVKELSRTAAPEEAPETAAEYSTAVVDADLGTSFSSAHDETTAITGVVNGVEGKEITLYGNDSGAIDVTLSTTGNIALTAGATLASSDDFIVLISVDGIWREVSRTIA